MKKIQINEVKTETGVGFGTSGVRDLILKLTDRTVYLYTRAFLAQAAAKGNFSKNKAVAIAGDLRQSTERLMKAVALAIRDENLEVINCGRIPTPAVVYFGLAKNLPSIMVTGSHIPDDRNGIKYNLAEGEVLKSDEAEIGLREVEFNEGMFNEDGSSREDIVLPVESEEAKILYLKRYLDFFDNKLLTGKNIGIYGHSAVGRELMVQIIQKLGANVEKLGYAKANKFEAIDTDLVDEDRAKKLKLWQKEKKLDHIMSTDGDGDRPLLTDENGVLIRSEMLPVLAGKYLGIEAIAVTITASTAVDKSGFYKKIKKTKVGSSMVVEAMTELAAEGYKRVGGYELNGGLLIQSDITINNEILMRLPTRDALLPILAVLAMAKEERKKVKELVAALPKRFTYSLSIKNISWDKSQEIINYLVQNQKKVENIFGQISDINKLDGLRFTFYNGEIVHFRASKNAPELKNYCEAESYQRAKRLSTRAKKLIEKMLAYKSLI